MNFLWKTSYHCNLVNLIVGQLLLLDLQLHHFILEIFVAMNSLLAFSVHSFSQCTICISLLCYQWVCDLGACKLLLTVPVCDQSKSHQWHGDHLQNKQSMFPAPKLIRYFRRTQTDRQTDQGNQLQQDKKHIIGCRVKTLMNYSTFQFIDSHAACKEDFTQQAV